MRKIMGTVSLAALAVAALLGVATVQGASAATLVDKGTFTLDSTTNLDWLDLNQTLGFSYNQVISNAGINFIADGWRYATAADLGQLFTDAGGSGTYEEDTDTATIAANATWTTAALLADLLGSGHNDSFFVGQGILADVVLGSFQQTGRFAAYDTGSAFHADLHLNDGFVPPAQAFDSFLVRDHVLVATPIPPSLLMFGTALGVLGFAGWRRRST
jgi:hypothetical protein